MEKVILVGLRLPKTKKTEISESLEELARLAETAGASPEMTIIQNRQKMDPAYLIGEGKAREIGEIAKREDIHTIIFDEELKPGQQKNLEELTGAKIVDRTRLILDIFAKRARSKEGILQVERAQTAYFLPRITERFGRFEQQTGGIGTRGPGEKKLEVDQRRLRDKLATLDREIEEIRNQRGVVRQKRIESGQPVISIVGYTNAGKSTLLNALNAGTSRASHSVYADNKLFATLDPTTRQVKLPGGRIALFTDTVGFIRKLPHGLVAAFRATLEEITLASCLVHVIDVSHPNYEEQVRTVLGVLRELKAENIPAISVYNKADLLTKEQAARSLRNYALLISAKNGTGINELLERIENIVVPKALPRKLSVPYAEHDILSGIYRLAVVKKREYGEKGIKLSLEATNENWEKIQSIVKGKLK
jgi:GTP-binding protein HflX